MSELSPRWLALLVGTVLWGRVRIACRPTLLSRLRCFLLLTVVVYLALVPDAQQDSEDLFLLPLCWTKVIR